MRVESPAPAPRPTHVALEVLNRPACDPSCDRHRGHIYVICYGRPTLTSYTERDWHPEHWPRAREDNYPITHYVGWTRQQPPVRRVRQHGARSTHFIARIVPGTTAEEAMVKAIGLCPGCEGSLNYYAENPRPGPWSRTEKW